MIDRICQTCHKRIKLDSNRKIYCSCKDIVYNVIMNKHDEHKDEWINKYESGISAVDIAKEFNVHSTSVYNLLRRNNIQRRRKGHGESELHPQWKGDKAGYYSIHTWVKARKFKPELCEVCTTRQVKDLANIRPDINDETYNRDLKNWIYLCRRCHMEQDGRLENFINAPKHKKVRYKSCHTNVKFAAKEPILSTVYSTSQKNRLRRKASTTKNGKTPGATGS